MTPASQRKRDHVKTWSRFLSYVSLQQRETKLQLVFVICSLHFRNHLSYSVLDARLIVSGSGSGLFWDWIKIKDQIKARLGSGYYILSPLHTVLSQKKSKQSPQKRVNIFFHVYKRLLVSHQKDHRSTDATTITDCWCYSLATKGGLRWLSDRVRNSGWPSHSVTAEANHVHNWKTEMQQETLHWSMMLAPKIKLYHWQWKLTSQKKN